MNQHYKTIHIPKELDPMIKKALQKDKRRKTIISSLSGLAAALVLFAGSLNVSPSFAETMSDIPGLGNLAVALTFRDYEDQSDEIKSQVSLPHLDIDESDLDDYINTTIEQKIALVLEEAQVRAEEYKQAYLETGGTEEGYAEKNMTVTVDYQIFSQDENYLSFKVYTHETLAAVYAENLYMTLDLKNRKLMTLEDLLGKDYQALISQKVKADIIEDEKDHPDKYFGDHLEAGFTVREDIDFYLEDGKLYVIFDKYELAAGTYGNLIFEIPMSK